MANICSVHQGYVADCSACNCHIKDFLPDYDRLLAEAQAKGLYTCKGCGFEFYLTTDMCPMCCMEADNESS